MKTFYGARAEPVRPRSTRSKQMAGGPQYPQIRRFIFKLSIRKPCGFSGGRVSHSEVARTFSYPKIFLPCPRMRYDFFCGTLAPFLRASDRPMAIACFRLVTLPPLPPLPERSVPRFSRCIALFTLLPAAFPYLAIAFLVLNVAGTFRTT